MSEEKTEIHLPSRLESVEEAAQKAESFGKQCGFADDVLQSVDMAVREAVANAVKHGNLLDETKQVEITLECTSGGFGVTVRDFGKGFEIEEIPDPTAPENLLKASGRGILFMRSFMDEVEWFNHAEGGMMVKMLKKR